MKFKLVNCIVHRWYLDEAVMGGGRGERERMRRRKSGGGSLGPGDGR